MDNTVLPIERLWQFYSVEIHRSSVSLWTIEIGEQRMTSKLTLATYNPDASLQHLAKYLLGSDWTDHLPLWMLTPSRLDKMGVQKIYAISADEAKEIFNHRLSHGYTCISIEEMPMFSPSRTQGWTQRDKNEIEKKIYRHWNKFMLTIGDSLPFQPNGKWSKEMVLFHREKSEIILPTTLIYHIYQWLDSHGLLSEYLFDVVDSEKELIDILTNDAIIWDSPTWIPDKRYREEHEWRCDKYGNRAYKREFLYAERQYYLVLGYIWTGKLVPIEMLDKPHIRNVLMPIKGQPIELLKLNPVECPVEWINPAKTTA